MLPTEEGSNKVQVIAIPVTGGRLCLHFGHCEQFTLLDVDTAEKKIFSVRQLAAPPHQPGLLPRWLHDQGVTLVIAGGMGESAQGIFAEYGIKVIIGAPGEAPESLAWSYLDGTLQPGNNACDH